MSELNTVPLSLLLPRLLSWNNVPQSTVERFGAKFLESCPPIGQLPCEFTGNVFMFPLQRLQKCENLCTITLKWSPYSFCISRSVTLPTIPCNHIFQSVLEMEQEQTLTHPPPSDLPAAGNSEKEDVKSDGALQPPDRGVAAWATVAGGFCLLLVSFGWISC